MTFVLPSCSNTLRLGSGYSHLAFLKFDLMLHLRRPSLQHLQFLLQI